VSNRYASLSPTFDAPYAYRDGLGVLGPGSPMFEGTTLRTARIAWAGRKAAPFTVLLLGDSITVGYYATTEAERWARIFSQTLHSANGQRPGLGYQSKHSLLNYLQTWSNSGTVAEFGTSGLGYGATSPAANGGWIETTGICDRFWIRYTAGTLIGKFGVQIDGGSSTNVPAIAGTIAGGYTWDSGPLTRGSHTVRITSTDATFAARIEGAQFFDGNGNTSGSQGDLSAVNSRTGAGVRVVNGAKFGTRASDFSASSATTWWTDGMDKVNPNLVVIAWGVNEIGAGDSASSFATSLTTVINRINTVMTAAGQVLPSYLLVVPHGVGADASTITAYRTAIYQTAQTLGCAVLDRNSIAGFVGTSTADVWGYTSSLDGATRKHLSNAGHRLMGEHAADWFLRAVSYRPASVDDTGAIPAGQLPTGTVAATVARTITGTSDTLALTDAGQTVETTSASAVTETVPANSTVAFPIGTVIQLYQSGAGQVTVTAAGGVTLRAPGGAKTRVQYSTVTLRKRATDEWIVSGDATT
jgi:lysophospholipase L1-like esterase